MLNLIAIALLLAQTQPQQVQPPDQKVDGSQYNYYGDDQQQDQQQQEQRQPQPITRPQPQPPGNAYGVRGNPGRAPPPPRYEQPQGPHGQGAVWIAGYWMPRGNEHQWVPGHWAYPPAPGYQWESPRWENIGGAWTFYEGHWLPLQQPQAAIPYTEPPPSMEDEWTTQPPPTPMNERQPPMPFSGAVWIPGYWHWTQARYTWVAGRWSPRPPYFFWEPHRWVRSPDGRFREQPGYWRR